VEELRPGLWHWTAMHPNWTPGNPADEGAPVSSYAIEDGDRLLLLDPLALPPRIVELAGDRQTAVVLTCPWHERDSRRLVDRFGAPVFVPPPDEGSPDVAWLVTGGVGEPHLFSAGDRLPVGVTAFPGKDANDVVLWIEDRGALVLGDTLIEREGRLQIPLDWLSEGVTREQVVEVLRPLLELPLDLVLPTHGAPTDRAGFARALS
jgi:glyoxylase-like metal-dependent hydrolase (beta-lactamase superfamily II)